MPKVWYARSTTAADQKQILRFVIGEVIVDQKRTQGKVWFKIVWQTGAVSEHWYIRRVWSYNEHAHVDQIHRRIRELHSEGKLDDEIADHLNVKGLRTAGNRPFSSDTIWHLRRRMCLPPVKPNGTLPSRWEDGTYSVRGASEAIGVIPGTIHKWLKTGRICGKQSRKGTPWKISLSGKDIGDLKDHVRRARRSSKEAS